MSLMEIPPYLDRRNTKGPDMTHAPALVPVTPEPAPTKRRRQDCYKASVSISIPLDMLNADSLATAIKAVQGIKDNLPGGATVEIKGSLGKL